MSKINLLHRTIIKDKNGKIIKQSKWTPCHSFLKQFLQTLESMFCNANMTVKDTGGTNRTIIRNGTTRAFLIYITAGDNDDNFGIVVGTGTTSPTNTDFQLETQITHGVGAGQLDYGAHSTTTTTVVGNNVDFVVSRDLYNGSGSTITVTEIGIYTRSENTVAVSCYFCSIRDVLTASQDVLNTQTLTIQYTLRTTV